MLVLLVVPVFTACVLRRVHASLHSSIPEDLYAFPKYRVSFLNGLPVANDTAERWLRNGLQGGEAEFLGEWLPDSLREIGSGLPHLRVRSPDDAAASPALEHMRLGPSKSYMCLIPPAPTLPPPPPDDATAPLTPSHSWSLLQPLSGTCLYHRQGWFTYSYCHNVHVRQFRELPPAYPHPPGARVVEEDPEWESYTLGRSSLNVGDEPRIHDEVALANNLELARQGAGQRYLVQRWSDGTMCDKSGRPREIEVQFHCSMTMTDTIMFVKETRTCEYVLVVHTPRLCGEPGFKSRHEQMPEAALRCREVVARVEDADPTLPPAQHPFRRAPVPVPVPVPVPRAPPPPVEAPRNTVERARDKTRLLQRALEALLGRAAEGEDVPVFELQPGEEEGEFFVSLDVDSLEGGEDEADAGAPARGKTLEEALRAAGYEIKGQKDQKAKKGKTKPAVPREEL